MGVSGCGKSTVAAQLAERLGVAFKDADELHPAANIARMSKGLALRDSDRFPWLEIVRAHARDQTANGQGCVIACSALKKAYRHIIDRAGEVLYVYLHGSASLIQSRLRQREGHFMPEALLLSQLSTLEVPDVSFEQVIAVDISGDACDVVSDALAQILQHRAYLKTQ